MPPIEPIILKPLWDKDRGRLYQVVGDHTYVTSYGCFTIPDGFISDLASIPRLFWGLLPRDGKYLEAALIHDYLYKTHNAPKKIADLIFLNEMARLNVRKTKRLAIYTAVKWFGGSSYRK